MSLCEKTVQWGMPEMSRSEQEWNGRALDLNYRCRICREQITFRDQQLYFAKGLCLPCLDALNEEANNPNSPTRKRIEKARNRGDIATFKS